MSIDQRTPPHATDTRLRDAHLQKALDSAPDAGQRPAPAIRAAILKQAHQAVAGQSGVGRRLLRWLMGGGGRTHMPWSAGLAVSLLIVAGVGLLWMQPGYRELARESPVAAASTEETAAQMDSDDAATPVAAAGAAHQPEAVQAPPPPVTAAPTTATRRPAGESPDDSLQREREKSLLSPSGASSESPSPAPSAPPEKTPSSLAQDSKQDMLQSEPDARQQTDAGGALAKEMMPERIAEHPEIVHTPAETVPAEKPVATAKAQAEPAPATPISPPPAQAGDWRQDWTALRPTSADPETGSATIARADASPLAGLLGTLQPDADTPTAVPSPSSATLFSIAVPGVELQLLRGRQPVGRLALYPNHWQFIPDAHAGTAPSASQGPLTPEQWQAIRAELVRLHLMDNALSPQ